MGAGERVLIFLAKTTSFVSVFWLSWIFIFRPISLTRAEPVAIYSPQERQQDDTYSRQLRKVSEQLAVVDSQQKRMDAILTQYEQHVARYEAILQHWEHQTNVRK